MKTKYLVKNWAAIGCSVLSLVFAYRMNGQTLVNLGTQGRNIDFSNAAETRPTQVGTSLPASCATGDLFFNTSGAAGKNLFGCASPNVWALVGLNTTSLADPGTNGIVLRTAANTTTAITAPLSPLVGTTDSQTLTNKSIDASEINSGTLSGARLPAFSGDVTTVTGSTATTLNTVNNTPGSFGDATHTVQMTIDAKGRVTAIAQVPITGNNSPGLTTVNSTPGTFGSTTQVPVITVNGYGQITAISTATVGTSGSSGNSSPMSSGTLSSIPSACSSGALYVATDQPVGQQLYTCSSSSSWTQFMSLGGSGALAFTNGSLDIVPGVMPRLTAANNFTGMNTFSNGILLASSASQPGCTAGTRGLFWFLNNGSARDGIQVCVYNGSSYNWISLY